MDLSSVDLYSTSPPPEALPGMRVVSHAGTQHLQCPVGDTVPERSRAEWAAQALTLGKGFDGRLKKQAGSSLASWADWLNAGEVARLLKGQAHLPQHLAGRLSASLLTDPLRSAVGADVLFQPPEQQTFHPLENQLVIVGLLLAHGARPDLRALNYAAEAPNPAILRRLLKLAPEGGWDFTGEDAQQTGTPLHAVRSNHWSTAVETVDLLIDAGVPIDQATEGDDMTPLAMAVKGKAWSVVRRLLERGANPDIGDMAGTTPLHWAARGDDVRSIDLLLLAGAHPSPRLTNGNTPLNEAARVGSVEALQHLLGRGFDPFEDRDSTYPDGRCLHLARHAAAHGITPTITARIKAGLAVLESWLLRREALAPASTVLDNARTRPRL